MQVNTILEQLLFTTVRITTTNPDGSTGLGTGFIYSKPLADGLAAYALITNKHVVAGATSATLHFIAGDAKQQPHLGRGVGYFVANPGTVFKGHPDPDVDVALMALGDVFEKFREGDASIFIRAVTPDLVATPELLDGYEPIEPVTFIGYPNGLFDSSTFLPIVRRGHSATALNVDYEGKPIFLIDASVFPGSSGSPVFLWTPSGTADKFGNIALGGPGKVLFLGVVAAVYQRQVPVLASAGSQPFVNDALDIGIVYKATAVRDLVDLAVAESGEVIPAPVPEVSS